MFTTPTKKRLRDSNKEHLETMVHSHENNVPIFCSNRFINLEETPSIPITKELIPEVPGAFILHNFFSSNECVQMIAATEKMGYDQAKVNFGGGAAQTNTTIRNNDRVVWQNKSEDLQPLFSRLMPFLPDHKNCSLKGLKYQDWRTIPSEMNPYALNERLRFFKYTKGQRFIKHYDGGYFRNDQDRSYMTFIAYLQPCTEGGHTEFFDAVTEEKITSIPPTAGDALLFYHQDHPLSPMHSGAEVISGTKYAIRSDLMYKPGPAVTFEDKKSHQKKKQKKTPPASMLTKEYK